MLKPAQDPQQPAPDQGQTPFIAPHRPRPPRRSRRWPLALGLAGVIGAGIVAWQYLMPLSEPEISYVTVAVQRGDIEDNTTAVGTLQPLEFVDVGAQVSGQLKKVHVELGADVREGDLLAEIDSTVLQTRVEAGRSNLVSLRAQLEDKQAQQRLTQQQFDRQARLMKDNATSQEAYQASQAQLASATAQIDVLRAQIKTTESNLKADEANLGYTQIKAPMSGTVVSQTAKQGQTLNANQQAPIILRIADLSTMTVQTQVSEADIGRLRLGMEAYFTILGQPNRRWAGTLRKILPTPEVLNNVVLYNALFDVPNAGQELRTQMTAQVFFVVAKADKALTVPVSSLRAPEVQGRRGGNGQQQADAATSNPRTPLQRRLARQQFFEPDGQHRAEGRPFRVQVLKEDGTVEDRNVMVGVTNRVTAEVLSGLDEGEKVVIGTHRKGEKPSTGGFRNMRLS
jgi:macrolide-specific efflux system membrane fusion protein